MTFYAALRCIDAHYPTFMHHPGLYILHTSQDPQQSTPQRPTRIIPSPVVYPDRAWYDNPEGSPRRALMDLADKCLEGLSTGTPYLGVIKPDPNHAPVGVAFAAIGYRSTPAWLGQSMAARTERSVYAVDTTDAMYRLVRPQTMDASYGFCHAWHDEIAQQVQVHPALRVILSSLTIPHALRHAAHMASQEQAKLADAL